MKILHIISSLASGGAEIYVRDLSKQMLAEGHEVCIVYISDAKSLERSIDFENEFKRELAESGVEFLKLGSDCMPYKLWIGGFRLHKAIKRFRPDVIHSHLYYGLFFKALAFTKVATIYTHHSIAMGKGRYLYALFNRLVDCYIGISRDCAGALSKVGAAPVVTIYNGVNTARLCCKKTVNNDSELIRLLAVGRLSEEKNFSLLIDSVAEMLGRHPEWGSRVILQIAGEGPLMPLLQQKIEQASLNGKVQLLGNRNDVSILLSEADIFVMSSNFEGLPIALLEALMTGLPAIVTDVGGCRDLVETCNGGVIVSPFSSSELAVAMANMISNSEQRRQMGLNAREGSRRFSIENACSEHLMVYKSLI